MADMVERSYRVVKANEFIRKGRHQLSLTEQRIILFVISKIKPEDSNFQTYTFPISEFIRITGVGRGGAQYKILKDTLLGLVSKYWWMELENGNQVTCSWISKVRITPDNQIEIRLDDDLKPYLLKLKQNFAEYELLHCLGFRSRFSLILYEYLCSVHYRTLEPYTIELTVNELKDILQAQKYEWSQFRQKCLDVARDEINKYSDKNLEYEIIKQKKKVASVRLTISQKTSFETLGIEMEVEKRLNHEPEPEPEGEIT